MRKETLLSPVSGIISQVLVHSGSKVLENQEILNIEIMKLFYSVTSGLPGTLSLNIMEGEFVQEGQELGTILEDC